MSEAPDNHELARQFAVLEERMKTMQAENETALERISGEHRAALDRLRADMAQLAATLTDRHATARWWQTAILSGVIAAAAGIVTAIILAAT